MKQLAYFFASLYIILVVTSCIEPYVPPEVNAEENILVVDAFLNVTDNSCTVILSRTQNLSRAEAASKESNANIVLMDESGLVLPLVEEDAGIYKTFGIPTTTNKKYWITITTASNENYESDKIIIQETPEIDELTWSTTSDGIEIYADTRGETGNSRHYRWDFDETWEYHSPLNSNVKFENGEVVLREDNITQCWKTAPSTEIIVATTNNLSENLIRNFPVAFIPRNSVKYLNGYSILVKQYAISEVEYEYWSLLKKNTENLGTLFDPQPSRITGNLHHVNNPNKLVLGFFRGSSVTQKRLFFKLSDLPRDFWFFLDTGCTEDTLLLKNVSSFSGPYLLTQPITLNSFFLIGYGYASISCVDCRVRGGTNIKPDFWP